MRRLARARALVVGLVLGGVAVLGVVPSAGAQTAPRSDSPEEYAARSAARIALLDLRCRPNPTPNDYMVAARVLDTAREFMPQDAELLRSRIRAAWSAGEREALDSLTKELVRLDPSDTVAQLRLASTRVASIQTVEGRLAAYDRLTGRAGASIDPSVRSRLALDAALLCRENNNFAGFADRLALSLQLDVTNKGAASLAWQSFGPMMETPGEKFELLLNLLMADPTDPNVLRTVSTELALAGGFAQAQRFHSMALTLYTQADSPVASQLVREAAVLRWQIDGPAALVANLNAQLGMMRQEAAQRIQQFESARMPTESLPRPEAILLSPEYNQMRLVAAMMADDKATVSASLLDMQTEFQAMVDAYQSKMQLATQQELMRSSTELWDGMASQLIAIAWAGVQDESLRTWTEQAAKVFPPESEPVRVLRAWTEMRLGDPDAALDLFLGLNQFAPLNRVGLGIAYETLGRTDEAMATYTALSRDMPLALAGVWARARVREATGTDPLATPERAALVGLAEDVPTWVDRMAADPRTFMAVAADLTVNSLSATDRATLRIRLTNLAPIPLGLGGDRPLNSRFMLSPRLQTGLHDEFARADAEVVELDRRLRLMPGETLVAEVWPDAGTVGWLAEVGALKTVRQRWRVLQGYRLDPAGVPEAGVLCLECETRPLVRSPLVLAGLTALELADALDSAGPSQLPGVLATVRARVLAPAGSEGELTPDDVQRLASVAAARYDNLPPVGRATMLAVLPTRTAAPGMAEFDRAALNENDPALAALALATRVVDAEDPTLAEWLEGGTKTGLGTFARALKSRLESPDPTYSRLDGAALGPTPPTKVESAAGSGP